MYAGDCVCRKSRLLAEKIKQKLPETHFLLQYPFYRLRLWNDLTGHDNDELTKMLWFGLSKFSTSDSIQSFQTLSIYLVIFYKLVTLMIELVELFKVSQDMDSEVLHDFTMKEIKQLFFLMWVMIPL